MSRRPSIGENWPEPFAVAKDDVLAGTVNLSELSPEQRLAAFRQLQKHEPGIAAFVSQMHQRFGHSELLVDEQTAKRLGVSPGKT